MTFESHNQASLETQRLAFYEKARAKAEAYLKQQGFDWQVKMIKQSDISSSGDEGPEKLLLEFSDDSKLLWTMGIEENDEYIDNQLEDIVQQMSQTYPGVDPFTVETHRGNQVIERVRGIFKEKLKHPIDLEGRIQINDRRIQETKAAIDSMIKKLPQDEQEAFKLALASGLEDFYYSNYSALRRRTEGEEGLQQKLTNQDDRRISE
jgi:hypothetical protein